MSLNRRKFLSMAGSMAALAATPFETLVAAKPSFQVPAILPSRS